MRIIAGSARSRQFAAPKGMDTRPTLDRVRESIFNVLQFAVGGARVLDLYAGSGAMALEALSRGAAEAVMVDAAQDACAVIQRNTETLGFSEKSELLNLRDTQALTLLREQKRTFDLVFLDPPYRMDTAGTVRQIADFSLIHAGSVIVIEYSLHRPAIEDCFDCIKERSFGETRVGFYTLKKEARGEHEMPVSGQL